jgi:hypothetical protein
MIQMFSVVLFWLTPAVAGSACLNGYPTVSAEYRLRRVFIGTVVSEQYEPATKYWDQEGVTYTVRVDEPLRGQLPKTIRLFSENSSGRFPMELGTKYLLFVYRDRDRVSVDNCGNSEVYSVSSPKLREVRRLKAAERRN